MLILVLAASVVHAYLQDEDTKSNAFQIAEDQVAVKETFTEPSIMENEVQTKTVAVQNTGSSDQYVRVFLDFSDSSVRDQTTITYRKNGSEQEKSWAEFLADRRRTGSTSRPQTRPTARSLAAFSTIRRS